MPNETKNYGTVITTAGAALIAKCILNGGKVNIKTAAAGDGGGEYYEPTVAQTALRGKKWEGDVASAAVSTTNANMIDVKITIDDSVGGFTIREMGLFDDDGTLIAICNTPDTEKVSTDGGVSGKLTMIMHIVVADHLHHHHCGSRPRRWLPLQEIQAGGRTAKGGGAGGPGSPP